LAVTGTIASTVYWWAKQFGRKVSAADVQRHCNLTARQANSVLRALVHSECMTTEKTNGVRTFEIIPTKWPMGRGITKRPAQARPKALDIAHMRLIRL
jgi:hypothetical protein